MNTILSVALFCFGVTLPVGAGSIKMLQNGINKTPIHAFITGAGMNIIDCVLLTLYYFGLSFIFNYSIVKIILYIAGIIILSKLGLNCFKKSKIKINNHAETTHKYTESLKDGICVSFVPSSLIFWVSTFGVMLSDHIGVDFALAVIGFFLGMFCTNTVYSLVACVIKKLSSEKVINYVNKGAGLILFGFAGYFLLQLIQILF